MEPCPGQPQELLTVNEQVRPPAPQNRVEPPPPKPARGGTHPPLCPGVGWDTCWELEGLTWPCATPVGLEGTLVLQVWGAVDLGCCGCGDGAAGGGTRCVLGCCRCGGTSSVG